MSKQKAADKNANTKKDPTPKSDEHTNISTADDINVDEDNAIESPKKSLTATESEEPKKSRSGEG